MDLIKEKLNILSDNKFKKTLINSSYGGFG